MRKALFLLFLVPGLLLARNSWSQEPAYPVNPAVSGRWVVTNFLPVLDRILNHRYQHGRKSILTGRKWSG